MADTHGHDAHGDGHGDGHGGHRGNDYGAAMTGFLGGAILIFAILFGVVKWTNGQFAGHESRGATKPAAGAPATTAPAH